ncbi:hypothetical protein ACFL2R_01250 [Patescibacteria group bacterium]
MPVGFGSGHEAIDDSDALPYEFQVGYLANQEDVLNGEQLIFEMLKDAPRKGVVLTLISALTDAANVLSKHHELFCEKVRRVVIMGGVACSGDFPELDSDGFFLPDLAAQNHAFDTAATEYLYRNLQENAIPMTVLSRYAAAQAKVPRALYDDMADTGHPVGIRLRDAQKKAIEELWRRVNLPDGDAGRLGLPGRCDSVWFLKAFCMGKCYVKGGIWELIDGFMLYDPCTLIAAMPGLREYFFSPYVHEMDGVEHFIIGLSDEHHGLSKSKELSKYLHYALVESLHMSMQDRRNVA